jgi:alpha-L-fucosidase
MQRRDFLTRAGVAALSGWSFLGQGRGMRPRPTLAQLRWQREELALFIHFTVNTFTDREWGDGTESPEIFAPSRLDPSQWTQVAKSAGFRTVVLTAKHHDGFCLWPTATTRHSVASSPWKGGSGDVVRELAEACRADGLGLGVYLSPWDRHEPAYGDSPRYMDLYCAQLEELLTRYGVVRQVWFDGANGEGPNGKRQVYDWPRIHATVRRFQPDAVIFSDAGPDVRWIGNEKGVAGETCWSTIDPDAVPYAGYDAPDVGAILQRGHPNGSVWRPGETDVSIRPGWFWHAAEDAAVRSVDNLFDLYFTSVGRNSKLLLNVPPTREGQFHATDVARLHGFAARRSALFARDLVSGASVLADSVSGAAHAAFLVVDGDQDTWWSAVPGASHATLDIKLRQAAPCSVLRLQEPISQGQAIEQFAIQGETPAGWRTLASGTTIGYCRLVRFPRMQCSRLRITLQSRLDTIQLSTVGLFDDAVT